MEIIFILAVFVAGYVLGRIRGHADLLEKMSQNPRAVIRALEQVERLNSVINDEDSGDTDYVDFEQHGSQYYAYDRATREFLGQGSSPEAVIEDLVNRNPKRKYSYEKQRI
jgi:hypothetical protein